MEALGVLLLIVGGIGVFLGIIWWLAACFETNPIWGWLGIFTFPAANIVWLVLYPRKGWKPVSVLLLGAAFGYGGYLCFAQAMGPTLAHHAATHHATARAVVHHVRNAGGFYNPYALKNLHFHH